MVLARSSSTDETLAQDNYHHRASTASQLESFPPLFITNSNILNSPSLRLEPVETSESLHTIQGSRRWWILSLSCLLLFGNYFAYDNPAALNTQLQKYLDMPYNDYQYLLSTLYSVYSLPNTVLPFLFGHLVDRLGPQRVLLVLSSCVCVGQTIFAIGVQSRQIWMMLIGRAIFGIGGESCGVAQASITTMQFRGHELAFALGLNLCIARFGSVVNTLITPWVEQNWGVPTAIWVGTLSCVASFISAIGLVILISNSTSGATSKSEVESTPLLASGVFQGNSNPRASSEMDEDDQQASHFNFHDPPPTILGHLPGLLRREASFSGSIHSVRFTPGHAKLGTRPSLHIITDSSQIKEDQEDWLSRWWSDLKYFPPTFWLICGLTVLLYGTVVPFNNIASDFLQSKWYPGNPRRATAVMGIPDTLGAVLVPGFGIVVDRYGGRASALIASAFIMVIVHLTLGFTMLSPVYAFSLLGIAYSMYGVALWPSIACVVTSELHLGKAYGISSSFLNISLTLVPPIVATILVIGDSFIPVEMFFIAMGLCGIFVGYTLKIMDLRDGGALEMPEIEVEVPVILTQPTASNPASAIASPALSQSQAKFAWKRNRQRPALSTIQTAENSGLKRWPSFDEDNRGQHSRSLPRIPSTRGNGDQEDPTDDETQENSPQLSSSGSWSSPTIGSSPPKAPSGASPRTSWSPMTERFRRTRKWFGRPLLQRTLTRVGSPLLQQYTYSPRNNGSRYGSVSSPSIVSLRGDGIAGNGPWDLEGGTNAPAAQEEYSVNQHPILYNPLRGSSGSFRISRNAKPISFGEGEEGRIFLNGQVVEPSAAATDGFTATNDDGEEYGDDEGRDESGHEDPTQNSKSEVAVDVDRVDKVVPMIGRTNTTE
ncbi:hypothetical protein EMPS_01440 [Entomortierella parvispora]|uniref:Lysosomal dipeptide transporter MFSD1 n=1 Tax=Entomortierella parvispora TaxID=205924 RepID=A0A9P3H2Z3_9FUNG|nr:hypothetical protein EMPS_01440 [Entomortierella parvispora]